MTVGAEFFAALIQATATITGLIVGFRAVQYQVERQQRIKNTRYISAELPQIKEQYQYEIRDIVSGIEKNFEDYIIYDVEKAREARITQLYQVGLADRFEADGNQYRDYDGIKTPSRSDENVEMLNKLTRELNNISWFLDKISVKKSGSQPSLDLEELEQLKNSAQYVALEYGFLIEELFDEPEQISWTGHRSDLLDLSNNISELLARAQQSTLRNSARTSRTLRLASASLLVGVLVPQAFLMTPADPIIIMNRQDIFYLQLFLLLTVTILLYLLLRKLLSEIGNEAIITNPSN